MENQPTTYWALFESGLIKQIEIPRIQRDYAQGRADSSVRRIRGDFVDILCVAVGGGESINLDFVYGEVRDGVLSPLDGQQRLTTLFLLHWYVAAKAGVLDPSAPWTRFSYAVRPSARAFCERLAASQLPEDDEPLSTWIADQPWYRYSWRHDPTVQGILVMLDALQNRLRGMDWQAAWTRLSGEGPPAITFHVLPIEGMGLGPDIYIKMNSRGKPLTPFENFKARFEQMLESSCPERKDEFAKQIDGVWADVFWKYRRGDFIVDDAIMRYFDLVTEIQAWRSGVSVSKGEIAAELYGRKNSRVADHVDFLIRAFDTWCDLDIGAFFAGLVAKEGHIQDPSVPLDTAPVPLFGSEEVDLFKRCFSGRGAFNLQDVLLFHFVLVHRLEKTPDIQRRLRVLRNLIEASGNEIRRDRMPALLADVERLVIKGDLEGLSEFNTAQIAEERAKRALTQILPSVERAVFRLEDSDLLRGNLAAFELDPERIEAQAEAFLNSFCDPNLWGDLTGGLLTTGDYWRTLDVRFSRFGSGTQLSAWRELLRGRTRSNIEHTRRALGRLLDQISGSPDLRVQLRDLMDNFLEGRGEEERFDWRYYFVRYPIMRSGKSGIYCGFSQKSGFEMCMLDKRQMNSYYRDPYLSALLKESGVAASVEDPMFTGYEWEERWMELVASGTKIRCVDKGWALAPPKAAEARERFSGVVDRYPMADSSVLRVPQTKVDGVTVDTEDRVKLGASFLKALVEAGL